MPQIALSECSVCLWQEIDSRLFFPRLQQIADRLKCLGMQRSTDQNLDCNRFDFVFASREAALRFEDSAMNTLKNLHQDMWITLVDGEI